MKQVAQMEHKGIVAFVERDFVRVLVTVNEACGGCSARSSCAMGMGEKREITIYTADASNYSIGENVIVSAHRSIGFMAVVLCYIVPLVVLISAIVIANAYGCADAISALVALGATALYFAILAVFHKHISKKVTFKIHKL